jgi:hypothetical protein
MRFNPLTNQYEGGTAMNQANADPGALFPDSNANQGEPSLWNTMRANASGMDPKRKKILDAMLMRMAQPHYQPIPAAPKSDPFRYSPQ